MKEQAAAEKTALRNEVADAVSEQREEGFYLAKDQAQFLYPNIDLSPMGIFKEITETDLVGPDYPPRLGIDFGAVGNEEEENVKNNNN